jgi:hypothetical protein
MRNTKEILRQKWLLGRPHRAICASVGVSMGAVSLALTRAANAALTWDAVNALDDSELEARLYPSVVAAAVRPEPDCTWIHRERHRVGVTLELCITSTSSSTQGVFGTRRFAIDTASGWDVAGS